MKKKNLDKIKKINSLKNELKKLKIKKSIICECDHGRGHDLHLKTLHLQYL